MLYNICVLGTFLALAIMAQQWWIILFSLLFLSFPSVVYRYYRICDKCGRQSRPMKTYDEALAQATKDGWVHYDDGNLDYCPTCKSKMNKEN
jgi:hypothetical protein